MKPIHFLKMWPISLCFLILFIIVVGIIYVHLRYKKLANASLTNKHVVITGGSSGIGKCLAEEAARRGASVTIIARDQTKLDSARKDIMRECRDPEQQINSVSMNVCGPYEEVERSMVNLEKEGGPIFMLINCAGNCAPGILEETSPSDVKRMLEVNCLSAMYVTKAVVEGMKSRKQGHIVLVSSVAGLIGLYGMSAYCAGKFALRGFAEALQMEVGHCGIKVTVSLPPDTDTPGFQEELLAKPIETKILSEGGGLKKPEDVARHTMNDILAGSFYSKVGVEGLLFGILGAGCSPAPTVFHYLLESVFMGPLRATAFFLHIYFNSVINKCQNEKNKSKKAE